jgi:hypothetical protein
LFGKSSGFGKKMGWEIKKHPSPALPSKGGSGFCFHLKIEKKSPFEVGFRGMFCVKYIPPRPSLRRERVVFCFHLKIKKKVPLRRGI